MADVAPDYQTELGLAQVQRTVLLIICVPGPPVYCRNWLTAWPVASASARSAAPLGRSFSSWKLSAVTLSTGRAAGTAVSWVR